MARSSECTEQYAQKVFDSADIVRDACLHQLSQYLIAFPGIMASWCASGELPSRLCTNRIVS
jgi:hypothetical protein